MAELLDGWIRNEKGEYISPEYPTQFFIDSETDREFIELLIKYIEDKAPKA